MRISGRIPSSSLAESKRIQKRYHDILAIQYPKWRAASCPSADLLKRIGPDQYLEYEPFNCILYNEKMIGEEYWIDIKYKVYEEPNSDNLQVWITLRPAWRDNNELFMGRKSQLDKLESLESEERRQISDEYQKRKFKDADVKGLK